MDRSEQPVRDGEALKVLMADDSAPDLELNERALYGRTYGTAMGQVRWDKVAEGLGCSAAYVDDAGQLDGALSQAKASEGPSVVCVRTDRDANLMLPQDMLARFFEVYGGPAA